jgi:hypothetical protein
MQKSHNAIHVRAGENYGSNGGATCFGRRSKIRIRQKLLPKIRRRVDEEPRTLRWGNCHLSLRSGRSLEYTRPQPPAVRTSTIPLRETAPGGRAEDFDAHSSTTVQRSRTSLLHNSVESLRDLAWPIPLVRLPYSCTWSVFLVVSIANKTVYRNSKVDGPGFPGPGRLEARAEVCN